MINPDESVPQRPRKRQGRGGNRALAVWVFSVLGTIALAVGGVLGASVLGICSIFLGIVLFTGAFWIFSQNRWPVRKRRFAVTVAVVIAAGGSVWIHQRYDARAQQSGTPRQSSITVGDQNQIINGNSGSISINNQRGNKPEAKK